MVFESVSKWPEALSLYNRAQEYLVAARAIFQSNSKSQVCFSFSFSFCFSYLYFSNET